MSFTIDLCACNQIDTSKMDLNVTISNEDVKETSEKENNGDKKLFYNMYGYRRNRGLNFEDGELYYYEDGYKQYDKVVEGSAPYLLDVIIDKDGKAKLDKKKKKDLYRNAELVEREDGYKYLSSIPYWYSTIDYSKSYVFSDNKLYLAERTEIVKKYKNEFHTYRKTNEGEIDDNVNMPEDGWGTPRFNYLGEMNKRPCEETYYFFDDSSLAFDGVHEINGEKFLFNEKGVLVKNASYFTTSGIGYLANEHGVVIEKEGFYTMKSYNEKGDLDINGSYVALFEGYGGPFIERFYYVNSDGEIERNKLFKIDGAVYYSNEDGNLIRNSFLTNKYYFGNDYKLIDDSVNETNIEEVGSFIDFAFKNGSYDTKGNHEIYHCKLIDKKEADKYKEKIKKLKSDPKNVIDEDYMSIVRDNGKLYINGKLVRNRFVYDKDLYCSISSYCDNKGQLVKNDLVNVGNDIYLIDKYGNSLSSHKLTKWVIRNNFEGKTIDKLMQYENYFVDDSGRILFEYHDICENLIKSAKANNADSKTKVLVPQNMYKEKIDEIVKKENAIIPPDFENGFKVKEQHPDVLELPNVWKTLLIDIDNDGTNEMLIFKKDYIVYKYDNYVDDFEEGIHPRMYFLTADLYKYEKDGFKLLHSRKLIGCFCRFGELLRVGFKKSKLDRWLMYVEWRGKYYGDGSFVGFKYYDFDSDTINLKFTRHCAGSSVGEDAFYLDEMVNQMGADFKENNFYDYKESYLEQDAECKLVLGINKDFAFTEEDNYETRHSLPIEIVNYEGDITMME